MAKEHDLDIIAHRVRDEIGRESKIIARNLFPQTPPGMEKMSRPEYLTYVRRHWPEPGFRMRLLSRVGPKNFLDTAKEALGGGDIA